MYWKIVPLCYFVQFLSIVSAKMRNFIKNSIFNNDVKVFSQMLKDHF